MAGSSGRTAAVWYVLRRLSRCRRQGQSLLGAPNLTDEIWLYRSTLDSIKYTIANGRNNQMPAYADKLGANKVKLLAAYVQSLSADVQTNQTAATQPTATSNLQAAAQQ